MAFNGSGVYTAPTNSFAQAVTETAIDSANWNATRADLESALSNVICKDGQTTVTANLPMATYRHTGVSNATALTQYATADQVVDNALCYGGASAAGTDTYAVNLAITPGAYAAGQRYSFIADVANTGACTINFSSIGAADIKLQDGTDPYTNAIIANQIVEVEYDGTNMVLLNPYNKLSTVTATGSSSTLEITSGLGGTEYEIEMYLQIDNAGGGVIDLQLNGDTTSANYTTDSPGSAPLADNTIGSVSDATGYFILKGRLFIVSSRAYMFYEYLSYPTSASTPAFVVAGTWNTATSMTSITSISLVETVGPRNFASTSYIKMKQIK